MDPFKREFKRYKQRKQPPDLSEVIDFTQPEAEPFKKWVLPSGIQLLTSKNSLHLGLRPCSEWNVYEVYDHPGFIFIVNPFVQGSQAGWVKRCLKEYPQKPNICNLDAHVDREDMDPIWDQATSGKSSLEKSLLYKLRWVTLGYHYDWDSKTYSRQNHSEFPVDLAELIQYVASTLQFSSFKPEAGIVNYYHLDSTLSGHTDHSELDLTAPLFSLSFGQSAIFLLGGKTREEKPVAMYLRSGDIMIMAGISRLVYHAVPRILTPPKHSPIPLSLLGSESAMTNDSTTADKKLQYACAPLKTMVIMEQYIATSRINVNVRQVLGPGQNFLDNEA